MDSKAVVLALAVVVAAAVLTCAVSAQGLQKGSVQLTNAGIVEGITVKRCSGPGSSKTLGEGFIPLQDYTFFEFYVDTLSQGWRCDFEYKSAGTGVVHTANVLVWQGILSAASTDDVDKEMPSLISINTVPCIHCIWKIQADGFYRADDKNHQVFTRLAGWAPA